MKLAPLILLLSLSLSAQTHKFWDKENKALFAGVAVSHALDIHSTWGFRERGWQEVILSNKLVDNKPAFVSYSAGLVLGHIGGCALLHVTNHHKIERIASWVHIGATVDTAVQNYRLR